MREVFADTSYWIALLSARDELHAKATNLSLEFVNAHIVTSEMVLIEVLNGFSEKPASWRLAAAKLAGDILHSSSIEVVPQEGLFEQALARYRDFADKKWSVTDCASFLIMETHGIKAALTYDHHFTQAGFQALMR